jgi:transcriptional regulator with PAS, ATPase and Fis domain
MQVGLLRFLDRGEFRPVGSTRTLHADVRVLGATNQDVQDLVLQGRFRDDLLYRINTVTLRVPPLRERKEDLPLLAEHLLQILRVPGTGKRSLSPEAIEQLTAHPWPGNVRELRNVIERMMLMSLGSGLITSEDVLSVLPRSTPRIKEEVTTALSLDEIERRHIVRVLDTCGGNKTQAAKTLQIDYKTLLSKLKRYGVSD